MNMMGKVVPCLVVVISVAGVARAEPIVVFDGPIDEFQTVDAKFGFDSKLGRAWIDVDKVNVDLHTTDTAMKQVKGLSYDAKAEEIVYQKRGGNRVVCAKQKTFLGISNLEPTGNCPLQVSYEQHTVDDGFQPNKQTFAKITLSPEIASAQMSER